MPNPGILAARRFAGGLIKGLIPIVPDLFAVHTELNKSEEKNAAQRRLNALIIGGGGAAASLAVAGTDAIPAIAEGIIEGRRNMGQPPSGPEKLQQLQNCVPALNVDNHLRNLSYSAGKSAGISSTFEQDNVRRLISEAAKQCGAFVTPGERSGMYPSAVRGGSLNF
jgi:hypothetical protein